MAVMLVVMPFSVNTSVDSWEQYSWSILSYSNPVK